MLFANVLNVTLPTLKTGDFVVFSNQLQASEIYQAWLSFC